MEGFVEARPTSDEQPLDPWQSLAQSRVGTTVGGRFLLERVLGIGGTAAVYAARHRNGRALAVKVLHPEYAHHPTVRQRFLAEGYAANRVDHPDAVAVLDEGEDDAGNVYMVMELLRGQSLMDRLERGPLPKADVVSIALSVLGVLAQAHARGVVHRDIKPANLFETDAGAIKVLDFGIARVEGSRGAPATRPGTTLGTPAFMAPELAAGKLDQLDALTDIWALGATMFQLLSGETVHTAQSDNEALVLAATRPARSLATLRPDLEPSLVHTIDRALSFDRRARWPNAQAMIAALLDSAPALGLRSTELPTLMLDANETAPEMELPPSRPGPKRSRSLLGWFAAAAALLAAAVAMLFYQQRLGSLAAASAVAPAPDSPGLASAAARVAPTAIAVEPVANAVPPASAEPESEGAKVKAPPAVGAARISVSKPRSSPAASAAPAASTASKPSNPLFFPGQ